MKSQKSPLVWTLIATALILIAAPFSMAISVRSLSLDEMTSLSDRIFLGTVLGVKKQLDPRIGFKVVTYSFRVVEGVKGVKRGETITVRQIDTAGSGLSIASGMPSYRKGSTILLFLHGDSRFGLTSPVGQLQGVFREVRIPGGGKGYLNGVDNRNLAGSAGQASRSSSGDAAAGGWKNDFFSGPLSLETISDMVADTEKAEGSAGVPGK